jgi:hypothetical protein
MLLPLAQPDVTPEQVSADFYYRMRVRPIYKSYPVYHPGKEPVGYLDWLRSHEPQLVFDSAKLKTQADWVRAGELVFEAPLNYRSVEQFRDRSWYESTRVPLTREGVMPFLQYVIRKKGWWRSARQPVPSVTPVFYPMAQS